MASQSRDRGKRRRVSFRILLLAAIGLPAIVVGCGGIWLHQVLKGSLPQLDGEITMAGLSAPVTVERDNLGVPTIRGANRLDVAFATGFLHAQDRFFQMDLLRRSAAGELAELFGEAALTVDRTVRVHRFRMRARDILAALLDSDRTLLQAYSAGVNAGLVTFKSRPFEYLALRAEPAPWLPEDTFLVVYAMYLDLQHETWLNESVVGVMHDVLPTALYEFLTPRGTEWDAPLTGGLLESVPIPGPEVFDLRNGSALAAGHADENHWYPEADNVVVGSNNWAVAGEHTAHGGALFANDMHLPLRVPNIWYRASIAYPDNHDQERRVTGVTLPGVPLIVAGSNVKVAWGFTNSRGDWSDLVILEPGPNPGKEYLTPDGPRRFKRYRETLRVKDGDDRVLEVDSTIWGPVIDTDYNGRRRALRWVAYEREAANMALLGLEAADTLEAALDVANRTGMPAQNFVAADAGGRIGWTIAGPIPRRFGFDGRAPRSWADGKSGWDGWLTPAEYPRIVDPPPGRIWTANARVVSGEELAALGDGSYDLGARARQIRDDLLGLERATETDMLAIQLDDRALFLARWRDLLLEVLTPETTAADPRRRELRDYVEQWGGRAAIDSVGYRIVRLFRTFLAEQVFGALTASCKSADGRFDYTMVRQREGPLWRLVQDRPAHLLDPRYESWQAQFLAAVDATLEYLRRQGGGLEERTWGERNTSRIHHPLSRYVPGAGRWLDMPDLPLPGDINMPRVQTPTNGASERMVVSPGRETDGIFHMPAGQSAHPLSPFYRNEHEAWVKGEPTPFLPGPVQHTLILAPTAQ